MPKGLTIAQVIRFNGSYELEILALLFFILLGFHLGANTL